MLDWAVAVLRLIDDRTVCIFPYNIPFPSSPPYPGFKPVEDWLSEQFPDCITEVMYMEAMPEGGPVLKVCFQNSVDLVTFILKKA